MDTDFFENEKDAVYAKEMGISEAEFAELQVLEDGEETSADGLVYSYYVKLDIDGPWRIMRKIPGLEEDGTFRLHPSAFDRPEPEEE